MAKKERDWLQCCAMAGQTSRGIFRTSPTSLSVTPAPSRAETRASSFGTR